MREKVLKTAIRFEAVASSSVDKKQPENCARDRTFKFDVVRKIFYFLSISLGGTNNVVNISFVQGWFCSRVLIEVLFLDMPHEETRIIRSQTAPHRDSSCLPIKISIERECVQCKNQFCKANQSTGWWLQDHIGRHKITRTHFY